MVSKHVQSLLITIGIITVGVILFSVIAIRRIPKEDRRKATMVFTVLVAYIAFAGIAGIVSGIMQFVYSFEDISPENFESKITIATTFVSSGMVSATVLMDQRNMFPAIVSGVSFAWGLALSIILERIRSQSTDALDPIIYYYIFFPIFCILLYFWKRVDALYVKLKKKFCKKADALKGKAKDEANDEAAAQTKTHMALATTSFNEQDLRDNDEDQVVEAEAGEQT